MQHYTSVEKNITGNTSAQMRTGIFYSIVSDPSSCVGVIQHQQKMGG